MQERKRKVMITLISSILAFAIGFVFAIFCLVKCSEEKWQKFKKAVETARKEVK